MFSASWDRSVKVWNLENLGGFVENLFGHEAEILGIDCLERERAITCGGRDRSVRIWKIPEESQLVFHAHSGCGSIECVSLINEDHFVTGSDDGFAKFLRIYKKIFITHSIISKFDFRALAV